MIRAPGAALLPVDDEKVILERRVVVSEQRRLARPGPAVEKNEYRRSGVAAAEPDRLIESAEPNGFHGRDAARDHAASAVDERVGRRASGQRWQQRGDDPD